MIKYISQRITISEELEEAIRKVFVEEKHSMDEVILLEGHYAQKLYFIEKGIIRAFYHGDGKEVSNWFYAEGYLCTSWYSFLKEEKSVENLQCIEDCHLYAITLQKYQALFKEFPEMERFGRIIAEEQLSFIDYMSRGYMFLSAKEKYDLLLSFFPDIELRVKLGQIASYLGISQETLSRIRLKR
ncbi:MAG: Crp/Fnr family transcriptional regulator [Bacteroidota bacterium]